MDAEFCVFSASLFWSNRKDERNDLNARNKNHEERNKCVRAFAAKPEEIKSREKINQARRWELDFFFLWFTCLFQFFRATNWTLWNEFSFFFSSCSCLFYSVAGYLVDLRAQDDELMSKCWVLINCCHSHFHLWKSRNEFRKGDHLTDE